MPFEVSIATPADLEPRLDEQGTSAALVRGMAAGLHAAGVPVPGFDAQVETTLPPGGGLSSSAAFEMAVGRAMEALAGATPLPPLQLAAIGAKAEQQFFGKPCGLQDQSASACGGICLLDFAEPAAPTATPIAFDFAAHGYAVVLERSRRALLVQARLQVGRGCNRDLERHEPAASHACARWPASSATP